MPIILLLSAYLRLLGEKEAVQIHFVHEQLLLVIVNVVDQNRLRTLAARIQTFVEILVLLQIKFNSDFGWAVFAPNVHRHDYFVEVQSFQVVLDDISLTSQVSGRFFLMEYLYLSIVFISLCSTWLHKLILILNFLTFIACFRNALDI